MLNDIEKDALQIVLNNEYALRALNKIFYGVLKPPKVGVSDDNAILGEKYRAYEASQAFIDKAFADLQDYRLIKKPVGKENRGR